MRETANHTVSGLNWRIRTATAAADRDANGDTDDTSNDQDGKGPEDRHEPMTVASIVAFAIAFAMPSS